MCIEGCGAQEKVSLGEAEKFSFLKFSVWLKFIIKSETYHFLDFVMDIHWRLFPALPGTLGSEFTVVWYVPPVKDLVPINCKTFAWLKLLSKFIAQRNKIQPKNWISELNIYDE